MGSRISELWLVQAWFFGSSHTQYDLTCLENIHQLEQKLVTAICSLTQFRNLFEKRLSVWIISLLYIVISITFHQNGICIVDVETWGNILNILYIITKKVRCKRFWCRKVVYMKYLFVIRGSLTFLYSIFWACFYFIRK